MQILMIPALVSLIGCSGSGSQYASPSSDARLEDGTPRLDCPDGTEQQSGTTETGEEYWCARGAVMYGPFVSFYANGNKEASGTFVENQRSGQWTWWYDNAAEGEEQGQTRMKGKYDRGKQIGAWRWWHPNGNRKMEGDFLHGRKQGQWTTFYESGHRESEGMYHNNNKNEEWRYYDDAEGGKVSRVERYENGELVQDKKR